MSERFIRVFSLPNENYAETSPVAIKAGALLRDNLTGKIIAQLKLQNISDNKIKAVEVKILPMDMDGEDLGEAFTYQYMGLSASRDEVFGTQVAVFLADTSTRQFNATVTKVIFENNEIWLDKEEKEILDKRLKEEEQLNYEVKRERKIILRVYSIIFLVLYFLYFQGRGILCSKKLHIKE